MSSIITTDTTDITITLPRPACAACPACDGYRELADRAGRRMAEAEAEIAGLTRERDEARGILAIAQSNSDRLSDQVEYLTNQRDAFATDRDNALREITELRAQTAEVRRTLGAIVNAPRGSWPQSLHYTTCVRLFRLVGGVVEDHSADQAAS